MRGGGTLVVFPEGRPSPGGEIGPLRRGLPALVRRAKPEWFLPVGIAYDPLVSGRTRVVVSVGQRVPPPDEDVEGATLQLLRRATPLTCGQWLAHERLAGGEIAPSRLAEAVEATRAEGRPVEPELLVYRVGGRVTVALNLGEQARSYEGTKLPPLGGTILEFDGEEPPWLA